MKDIFTILKEEHKKVQEAFENLMEKPTKEDWSIIVNDLGMHMESEEKALYPQLKELDEMKDNIIEANEEHKHAKMILKELEKMDMSHEEFMPKLKVLKEMVEHHVKEEEEEMFPKAKEIITDEQEMGITNNYIDAEEEYKKHNSHGMFSFLHPKN